MKDNDLRRAVAVLTAPTETFRSINTRPTWWAPFLIVIPLGVLTLSILGPEIDWQATIETKLELSDREVQSPEKLATVVRLAEEYGTVFMVALSLVSPFVVYPLMAAILRGALRLLGGVLSFKTSLSVVAHGLMPGVIAFLVGTPALFRSQGVNLYNPGAWVLNLSAFAGDDTRLEMWTLLRSIDPFSIWSMALMVIGYSITAGISRARAAVAVVGLWAIWVALNVGLAALERILGGPA